MIGFTRERSRKNLWWEKGTIWVVWVCGLNWVKPLVDRKSCGGRSLFLEVSVLLEFETKKNMSLSLFLISSFTIYLIYYFTLFPSIPGGDSGEILAESCHLGIVHPPGYPLLTILFHVIGKISLPRYYFNEMNELTYEHNTTIAWRINHLCCIFGSFAASFISLTVAKLLKRYIFISPSLLASTFVFISALGAGYAYAFSPIVWEHSIGSEVFSFNNFLCSLLIYLTVVISHSVPSSSSSNNLSTSLSTLISLGAFVSGCCLANQHASVLLLIILIPFVLFITQPYIMSLSFLVFLSLVFSLSFSSYFYLLFASFRPSLGSWGDTTSFQGLIRHILRSEYGTFQLGVRAGSESTIERVLFYLSHLISDGSYLIIPLFLVGIFFLISPTIRSSQALTKKDESNDQAESNAPSIPIERKKNKDHGNLKKRNIGKNTEKLLEVVGVLPEPQIVPSSQIQSPVEVYCLLVCWIAYVGIWHGVLSNIPLSSPMPYGVHARFWMQPDILVYIFAGCGFGSALYFLWMSISTYIATFVSLLSFPLVIFLLLSRFPHLDRSSSGYVMHHYGLHILYSISDYSSPSSSTPLLLSHTDLNWNTVRYLQSCEHLFTPTSNYSNELQLPSPHFPLGSQRLRSQLGEQNLTGITHLNFQLIPFPWFMKQQAPLYPTVVFPPLFKGVSTNRQSKENTIFIQRIIQANIQNPHHHPIYLDMQAINELEIGVGGSWGQYTLVSHGLVYRVEQQLTLAEMAVSHRESLYQLLSLRASFPSLSSSSYSLVDKYSHHYNYEQESSPTFFHSKIEIPSFRKFVPFLAKFPPGTWEHAVVSTYHDAHNQFALNLLTYSIESQKSARSYLDIAHLIDRLSLSSSLLMSTLHSIIYHILSELSPSISPSSIYPSLSHPFSYSIGDLSPYSPLSAPLIDLLKNTALSLMRYEGVLRVALDEANIKKLKKEFKTSKKSENDEFLTSQFFSSILTQENLKEVRERAVLTIRWFLLEREGIDKDGETFRKYLNSLEELVTVK